MPDVKQERTGWRDLRLSQRHRRWGWDCPAVDLDFIFLEYDRGKATAIVEYKHENAPPQYYTHPTYMALVDLGTRAGVPVFACRYADDFSWYLPTPLNPQAKKWLSAETRMTEADWVTLLYRIRGYALPASVREQWNVAV